MRPEGGSLHGARFHSIDCLNEGVSGLYQCMLKSFLSVSSFIIEQTDYMQQNYRCTFDDGSELQQSHVYVIQVFPLPPPVECMGKRDPPREQYVL